MNQELFKFENSVKKAEGAWDRQMKRDGHLKKESRDISEADPQHMSITARAFFNEFTLAKKALDDCAAASDLFGQSLGSQRQGEEAFAAGGAGGPGLSVQNGGKGPNGGSARKDHSPPAKLPDASEVKTPDGMAVSIVLPTVYQSFKDANGIEGLAAPKPTAKPVELNDRFFIVTGVAENYLILTPCIPAESWTENTFESLAGKSVDDISGLLFKSGGGNSKKYVACDYLSSVAVVAGDPLANVG